jgi:hypothetical protein
MTSTSCISIYDQKFNARCRHRPRRDDMSASCPEADIRDVHGHVRFGPCADILGLQLFDATNGDMG